ncbi:uncharacterized protein LOC126567603 [Anopheles maculipalpis]|uniref:uncharacterized protein LOC126567603 n=1 Tax=Anopheles maculipalpis TaxID=1496333 RepID=UPI002158CA31|nr:uncharacterized protein LOC126567603 [Anopheles maculipalpis]
MRTTRSAAKAASEKVHCKQERKYIRQLKKKPQKHKQFEVSQHGPPGEQKQESIPTINFDSSLESALPLLEEGPPNDPSPIAELGPEDVVENQPKTYECHQLVAGHDTISDPLVLLAGCLEDVKYEVINFESQPNKLIEEDKTKLLQTLAADKMVTVLKLHDEDAIETIMPSSKESEPAPSCSMAMQAEKLPISQSNKQASSSSFNGAFKLYRFMVCEWFYSHIDRPLFADGYSKNLDLGALLKTHFPTLFTRSLNRAEWNYVRMGLRKERPVRRLSPTFLLQERLNLERRREKLRFLMENSMIEYLDDDIPSTIPKPIDVGSKVRSTSFVPHYGSYSGEVVGVENLDMPYFRVRFSNTGGASASEQLLPDYRVALEQSFQITDASDTVMVTFRHLKQIALLEENLNEKIRLLQALENIRLNMAARHVLGTLNTDQTREQIERYDHTVRNLFQLNRTLVQLMKQVTADYEQHVSEPLTVEDDKEDIVIVDRYVVELSDQLLAAYAQMDNVHNNPAASQLWQDTMQRLRRRPEYLQQFETYLASNVGTLFNAYCTTQESS